MESLKEAQLLAWIGRMYSIRSRADLTFCIEEKRSQGKLGDISDLSYKTLIKCFPLPRYNQI